LTCSIVYLVAKTKELHHASQKLKLITRKALQISTFAIKYHSALLMCLLKLAFIVPRLRSDTRWLHSGGAAPSLLYFLYYPPPKRRADPQWQTRVVQLIRELESSRKQIGEILSDPHAGLRLGGGYCSTIPPLAHMYVTQGKFCWTHRTCAQGVAG